MCLSRYKRAMRLSNLPTTILFLTVIYTFISRNTKIFGPIPKSLRPRAWYHAFNQNVHNYEKSQMEKSMSPELLKKRAEHEAIKAANEAIIGAQHEINRAEHIAQREELRLERNEQTVQNLQGNGNFGNIENVEDDAPYLKFSDGVGSSISQDTIAKTHEISKEHQQKMEEHMKISAEKHAAWAEQHAINKAKLVAHHEEVRAERLNNKGVPAVGDVPRDDLNPGRDYSRPDEYVESEPIKEVDFGSFVRPSEILEKEPGMVLNQNQAASDIKLTNDENVSSHIANQYSQRVLTGKVDWLNDKTKTYHQQLDTRGKKEDDVFKTDELPEADRKIYFEKTARIIDKRKDLIENNERYQRMKHEIADYKFPKMVIVGSKKCGTGALGRALMMHPLVEYAGEQFYFNRYYKNPLDWYLHKMPKSTDSQIIYEKTPNYVYSLSIGQKIKNLGPNVKVINIMCDPIKRIYSDFLHIFRYEPEKATMERFDQLIDSALEDIKIRQDKVDSGETTWEEMWLKEDFQFAIKGHAFEKVILKSFYSIYLKKWQELYGPNILNLDGSKLYTESGRILTKVQEFLGLPIFLDDDNFFWNPDRGMSCKINIEGEPLCPGRGKGRSLKGEVPEYIKEKLRKVVDPFTRELEVMMGSSFSHWDW